jgi:hypothetical protein
MTTGAKIAIGCGVALMVAGIAAIVVLGAGYFWVKDKAEGLAANETRISDLKMKANANPFTRPADGVISEPRFEKFLGVRKQVFAVYEKNEAAIEAIGNKKDAGLGDVKTALGLLNDIRVAQAQALVDQGMSEEEYAFMVESVYKSAWAAAVVGDSSKKPSEAAAEKVKEAQDAIATAIEEAKKQGGPEAAQAIEESMKEAQQQAGEALSNIEAMDVPKANIELFHKYQADIKKYAMGGLELIGL